MSVNRLWIAAAFFVSAAAAAAQAPVYAPAPSTGTPATQPAAPAPPPEVEVGKIAPDFTIDVADASSPAAKAVKLSDLRGKVVVLAFYPADRSSGCTAELTKFRDEYSKLFGEGTVVIPISNDGIESHASWAREMNFPFALGSDPELAIAKQYGSWNPGRKNASRTVYVIGKDGQIVYRNLKFPALTETAYTELGAEVEKAR